MTVDFLAIDRTWAANLFKSDWPSVRQEPTAAPNAAKDAGHSLLVEVPMALPTVEPTPASEKSETGVDDTKMAEIEVEVDRSPPEREETGEPASTGLGAQIAAVDQVAPLDQTGQRSSAPDSDSEELVPVETDSEADAAQEGRRCPAPASDSDELAPATSCRRDEARHGADHDFFSSEPSRPSRSNLSRLRP